MPPAAPLAPSIALCTLNAKYIHASLGLRYLLANMGELRSRTVLLEFTVARDTHEVAAALLGALEPADAAGVQVIGFGVYIWNLSRTCELVRELRRLRPALKLVLGGPEVSHELETQPIVALADHVITGWGDISFPRLCQALLHGPRPLTKVVVGEQPALERIVLPYDEYTSDDLAHRLVYVEASRGCPFKCEFCLSSLDRSAWAFDLDRFLAALDALYRRGARNFKFVDRTFNLKIDAALQILQFFLARLPDAGARENDPGLFVHFEVIPDHLPERLKECIARFPAGVLQFEVGVQSFNAEVQRRISRKQDNQRTIANLRWLHQQSRAHVHADLIFGLPGETLQSFADGFDQLLALHPDEIQLGMLKRLRGTPLARDAARHGLVFEPGPPYGVLQTADLDAAQLQRVARAARYWDLVANSGRFPRSLPLLLQSQHRCAPAAGTPAPDPAPSAFWSLLRFADWLWARTGSTHRLTPEMLVDHLFDYLCLECAMDAQRCRSALREDYAASGARWRPRVLRDSLLPRPAPRARRLARPLPRQQQHQAGKAGAPPEPPPDAPIAPASVAAGADPESGKPVIRVA